MLVVLSILVLSPLTTLVNAVSSPLHRAQHTPEALAEIDTGGVVSPAEWQTAIGQDSGHTGGVVSPAEWQTAIGQDLTKARATATLQTQSQADAAQLAWLAETYRSEQPATGQPSPPGQQPPPAPAPPIPSSHVPIGAQSGEGDLAIPADPEEFVATIDAVKWNAHLVNATVIAAIAWRSVATVMEASALSNSGHVDLADTYGVSVAINVLLDLAKASGYSLKQLLHKPGTSTLTTTPAPVAQGYTLLPHVERILLSAASAGRRAAGATGATVLDSYVLGTCKLAEALQDLAWQIGSSMEEILQARPSRGRPEISIPNIGGACPVPEQPPETTTTVTHTTTSTTTTVTTTHTVTETTTTTQTTTRTTTTTSTLTTTETITYTSTSVETTTVTTLEEDLAIR